MEIKMTKEEILQIIKDLKEMGAKRIEVEGIIIEFNEELKSEHKPKELSDPIEPEYKDLIASPSPFDELTDEEILFWSSDYGKELENKRRKELEDSKKDRRHDEFI